MTRTRAALISTVLFAAGLFVAQLVHLTRDASATETAQAPRNQFQEYLERKAREAEQERTGPRPDLMKLPGDYTRPASTWRSSEKVFYADLLAKGRFDVLVVPFQVQDFAIDRTARSLMTAELASAIGAAQKKVPDPYLVARALGDGERRFDLNEVYRLAERLGVTGIVLGYVGHRSNNIMRMTIQYRDGSQGLFNPATVFNFTQFENLSFSDEDPPIEVFERLLPRVLAAVGIDSPKAPSPRPTRRFDAAELPLSPLRMVSDHAEQARDAYYLQLLAALAPRNAERTRERLNEKSMLAILGMSPASPDYRVLKARALMHMGLRSAALKALGTPDSAEKKHLFAMLNGNLPDAERYSAQIKHGARMVIASLESNDMAGAYGVRTQKQSLDKAEALKLPGDVWPLLAARAMTEWDSWSQQKNIRLKALLDREFPISSFTAEGIVRGAASLGDVSKVQTTLDLSVLDHVRKLLENQAATLCCAPLKAQVTALDYLDLIENLGTDNLMRHADFLTRIQGAPESALEFLTRIEGSYRDHPQFALNRARTESQLARQADGTRREGLRKSAFDHALNAMYWEQGQTRIAGEAWNARPVIAGRELLVDNFFASDYPFRSFYPTWQKGIVFYGTSERGASQSEAIRANEYAALQNSTFDFGPVSELTGILAAMGNNWDQFDEVLKSIENRFAGNPKRAQLIAKHSARKGDVRSAQKYYQEAIDSQPGQWQAYMDLGKLLFEEGNVDKASQTLMSYPGFTKASDENSVGLSNRAFEAGSLFYWSGNFERALPLYRIAAELKTGSDASMSSEIRINLLDGDYDAALTGSRERAGRYNSSPAYRDYLGMLHAMERSKEAWDGFNVLIGQLDKPEIWETPLVGHRFAGATESEIVAWTAQEPVRSAGERYGYTAMYLLRAGVTDRLPTKDLASAIAAIEHPVWKVAQWGHIVRSSPDGKNQRILSPVRTPSSTAPPGLGTKEKTRMKSDLVYFAEAYRAIRAGDFAGAKAMLEEASTLYDLTENVTLGYMLPYYAFAAAKAGDVKSVVAFLDKFPAEYRRFDYYLARAALAGIAGKVNESLQDLKLSLYRRPFTEFRPLYTEYEFAEICEWLYEATQNAKYRDTAVSWAKKVQAFNPWFAWAYAMEAKLSADANERRRAIAIAFYLDKKSERLAAIPKSEIDAAVRESDGTNPFLGVKGSSKKDSV
jgi:thioredoxin-like negative regulator of GroEL